MGYTNPKTIINQTGSVINQEIRNFNDKFNEEFDNLNAQAASNIQANMDILEERQMKRVLGDEAWYQNVEKYKPKGGYAEDTEAFLTNLHNDYYKLLGCDTAECKQKLEKLKSVPRQLSEMGGAYDAYAKQFEEASGKAPFAPGSLNAGTPHDLLVTLQNKGQGKKTFNYETGHVELYSEDADGKPIMGADGKQMIIDGPEFVRGAVSGNVRINTYGDPGKLRDEWQAGIKKEMGYDDLVSKLQDNRNPNDKKGYVDYTEANNSFMTNMDNASVNAILDDSKSMTDSYPVMVNDLLTRAKGDGPEAEKAKQALTQLDASLGDNAGKLVGEDGIAGTKDDLDLSSGYAAQALIGNWKNSEEQRAIGETYFKHIPEDSTLLKKNKILKTRTLSKPKGPSATEIKNANALAKAATIEEFNTSFNNQASGAETQQEAEDFLMSLGLFEKQKTGDSKGSIEAMIERGEAKVIQNEDGGFAIQISGATKEDSEGNITGGESRKTYDLNDPKDMNKLRDDFNINKDNYSVKSGDQNTSGGGDNTPNLNAAAYNSNKNKKPQDMGGGGVLRRNDQEAVAKDEITRDSNAELGTINNAISGTPGVGDEKNPPVDGNYYRNDGKGADAGVVYQFKNGKYNKVGVEKKSKDVKPSTETSAPVVKEKPVVPVVEKPAPVVKEKPTKVSYGQPKDISNDRVDKVADRILTWERASGNGINAGPHTDFGFNSGTKPKTQEEAVSRFEKEYGKKLVGGLNDEALFQAIDWNFNAGRDSKQMLLFASGLIPGSPAEQRAAINGKGNMTDGELNALYKKNEAKILKYVNGNNITGKKMELYMSPKMVKTYSKADLKTGLQKQWGPRMGMSKSEIDKWITDNFETIYKESKSLIGS